MIKEAIGGFCMALADSVPGVSGGTVAFIMGFYDQFIGSVHDLAFGKMEDKKKAIAYLIKLGIGWIIGMGLAVVILSALFESHIYVVSSLFIGFIAGAINPINSDSADHPGRKGWLQAVWQGHFIPDPRYRIGGRDHLVKRQSRHLFDGSEPLPAGKCD